MLIFKKKLDVWEIRGSFLKFGWKFTLPLIFSTFNIVFNNIQIHCDLILLSSEFICLSHDFYMAFIWFNMVFACFQMVSIWFYIRRSASCEGVFFLPASLYWSLFSVVLRTPPPRPLQRKDKLTPTSSLLGGFFGHVGPTKRPVKMHTKFWLILI